MLLIQHIDSLNDPELAPYKTLRQTAEHEREGIFVAEGEKVVARLMESSLHVVSLLTTEEWFGIYQHRLESRSENIKVFVGQKTLLSSIVGFHLHQGIMAVARIPEIFELETIVRQSTSPRLFVAIDGMTNSENLGVIVRNCVAFGVQALIVGETSSSPYLRRAVRNSMGTIFKLSVVPTLNLVKSICDLKSRFLMEVIAAHPRAEQRSLSSPSFRKDCCVVFGSEGYGISEKVLAACSERVSIPMMPGVDSLNVASASAVFLYEVMRQRDGRKSLTLDGIRS
jgi:tRNA G18 (ribose-2'-O)-methylase SpoU